MLEVGKVNPALEEKAVNSSIVGKSGEPHIVPIPATVSVSDRSIGEHRQCLYRAAFEEVLKAKRKGIQKQLERLIFLFFKIGTALPSSKNNCQCLENSLRRRNSVFSFKYQQNRFNYKRLHTFLNDK